MGHNHHHHNKASISGKNLLFTILLNLLITAAQIVGGFISGSLALISDAVHNFSDVLSLIVSYMANWLTRKKKQTLSQTFGYKRAEIVAAFINASTLIIIAAFLIIEAIDRLKTPREISGNIVIWLALLGIVANGIGVVLLRSDAEHNINMKSAYLHLFTDMLTSIAVLSGGIMIKYFQIFWIDPVLTLLISFYLIYLSWHILLDALKILMLFTPEDIVIQEIEKKVIEIEGIRNIHHIHIWQLNDRETHLEAHLEMEKDITISEFDKKCIEIEHLLSETFDISHTNLQPEFTRDEPKDLVLQE